MEKFAYMNYRDVNEKIAEIIHNQNNINKVRKEKPIGYSEYGLPIDHYTIGNGPKHIVVSGSFHA